METPAGRRRMPRRTVAIICAAIVAAGAALFVGRRIENHADTTLPSASCGRVTTHLLNGGTVLLQADRGALTCFGTAARMCRSASIEVWEMGVDAGTGYVFSIEPGGTACQAMRLSQDVGFNFGGSRSGITATACPKVAVTGKGVVLACGGQTILIPATVASPES